MKYDAQHMKWQVKHLLGGDVPGMKLGRRLVASPEGLGTKQPSGLVWSQQ